MDLKNLVVGIDLGTSNSAIAFSRTDGDGITVVPIEQLASLGKVHSKKTLPSALYLAPKEELGKNYNHLSWTKSEQENYIVGTFARQRGMHMAEKIKEKTIKRENIFFITNHTYELASSSILSIRRSIHANENMGISPRFSLLAIIFATCL